MASNAFSLTAYYDSIVSDWFNNDIGLNFPDKKTFYGKKISKLRYGENPIKKVRFTLIVLKVTI